MALADGINVFDEKHPHIVLLVGGDLFDPDAHLAAEGSNAVVHLAESISEAALQYMRLLQAGVELRAAVSDLFVHRTSRIVAPSVARRSVGERTALHLFEKCQYAEQGYSCPPGRFVLYAGSEKAARQAVDTYDTAGPYKLQDLQRVEIMPQSSYSLLELLEVLAAPSGWTSRQIT